MNTNKDILHVIIAALVITLIATLPTIISQQNKILRLEQEAPQTSQGQNNDSSTRIVEKIIHIPTEKVSRPLTTKRTLQELPAQPMQRTQEIVGHITTPDKNDNNQSITTLEPQPSKKATQRSARKKAQVEPEITTKETTKTGTELLPEVETYQPEKPIQTTFPYPTPPSQPRPITSNNTAPTYDSTMYLPVVVNNPIGNIANQTGSGGAGGSNGNTNNSGNNSGSNSGNNSNNGGGGSSSSSSGVSTADTSEILRTLQYHIPIEGGLAVNNLTPTTLRSRTPKTRASTGTNWEEPLIIDESSAFKNIGTIRFKEDIIFKPSANSTGVVAAIVVNKDNMTIDLYGYTLQFDSSEIGGLNTTQQIHGIYINPGVKNTKIVSSKSQDSVGAISRFTGYAIYASGNSTETNNNYDFFTNKIKQISIENILIAGNLNGIYLRRVEEATIHNSKIINNISYNTLYGINILNSQDIKITDCKVNQNISHASLTGIYIKDSIGVSVSNTQASYNKSLMTGNVAGITITASSASSCHSNSIFNCQANSNLCAYVNDTQSIGFHLKNQTFNNVIEKCIADGNSYGDYPQNNQTPTTPPLGYGIKLENSNSNQITDNILKSNLSYGFYDNLTGSTSFYTKNKSLYHPVANYDVFYITGTDATQPLEVITIYPGDLSTVAENLSPYSNIEVQQTL